MTLTGTQLGSILTAREAFRVTDDQGCFDPSRTNTVYDMLSDREPWFAQASRALSEASAIDLDVVKQGIRLTLWCRARLAEGQRGLFHLPPADEEGMPGFTTTPLCRLLNENMTALCNAYDGSGSKVYERVWEFMRQRMGEDLYSLWRSTQQWSPRSRGTLEDLQHRIGLYPVPSVPPRSAIAAQVQVPPIYDRVAGFVDAIEKSF